MGDHVEIVEAERPATQRDENEYLARVFREALERIADELNLAGSPNLLTDVPDAAIKAIRENREGEEAWMQAHRGPLPVSDGGTGCIQDEIEDLGREVEEALDLSGEFSVGVLLGALGLVLAILVGGLLWPSDPEEEVTQPGAPIVVMEDAAHKQAKQDLADIRARLDACSELIDAAQIKVDLGVDNGTEPQYHGRTTNKGGREDERNDVATQKATGAGADAEVAGHE